MNGARKDSWILEFVEGEFKEESSEYNIWNSEELGGCKFEGNNSSKSFEREREREVFRQI